jgi:hypothetical protein
MNCENLGGCSFYNDKMPMDRGLGQIQKQKYCEGEKSQCARYMVASSIGKENIPMDLYPIMMDRANKIIDEYYRKSTMKM